MEIQETYKIYQRSSYAGSTTVDVGIPSNSSWFFELEPTRFCLSTNLKECDIIPIFQSDFLEMQNKEVVNIIKDKIILGVGLFHTDDDQNLFEYPFADSWKKFTNKFLITETNLINQNEKVVNYDLLWNRQKLYFTEYHKINLQNTIWTYDASEKMFALSKIQKTNTAKRFLSATRVENNRQPLSDKKRQYYRKALTEVLKNTDNIFSDWSSTPIKILPPEEDIISEKNVFRTPDSLLNNPIWFPISNKLYSDTFVSVYIETLVKSSFTKVVTEKTFDPLIKGHFILPFGYCGLLKSIQSYGFELPSWINYDYDTEQDVDKRFQLFIEEFERLQSIDIKHFYEFFKKDYELLVHNRNVFFTRPYDTFYPSLIKALHHV